jgi:hypothetical protein
MIHFEFSLCSSLIFFLLFYNLFCLILLSFRPNLCLKTLIMEFNINSWIFQVSALCLLHVWNLKFFILRLLLSCFFKIMFKLFFLLFIAFFIKKLNALGHMVSRQMNMNNMNRQAYRVWKPAPHMPLQLQVFKKKSFF